MKRIFNALGLMLVSALTLTNCTKDVDAPVVEKEGVPFEIVASTVDTKTVNDGMSTLWTDGDKINVFHVLYGDEIELAVNDKAFTVADVETGLFTGELSETLDAQAEYQWYALYPYNEKVTTPGAQTAGYTYIGHKNGLSQNGYNSMAALAGSVCPLYGFCERTIGDEIPEIEMQHLSSVIAINVTNENDEPLTITTASFTAEEDIVGSYYINVENGDVSYKASGDSYVSSTATVNVTGGTALAKGESAVLYLAVKPFVASAGTSLVLSVNGYEKEIELSNDATFSAGKIKTVNFAYDATEEPAGPEAITVAEFLAKEVNTTVWYELTGVVSNIANTTYGNFDLTDETGTVYVYGLTQTKVSSNDKSYSKLGLKEGDVLTLMGTRAAYNNVAQVGGPAYYVSHISAAATPVIECVDNIVTITTTEADATIYYTIDGEDPTTASFVYDEPIELEEGDDFTVKAIAVAEGMAPSLVASRPCKWIDPNADLGTPSTVACYTLSTASKQGSNNSYTGNCDIAMDGITWNVNGNTQINPWRIGGKSITNVDRTVYSKTAYAEPLSKVEFVAGTVTVTWNSMTLYYSTNSDFSNATAITASGIGQNKTVEFAPDGGFPAGCYFKFVLNVTNTTTSNKYVQLKEIKFYGYEK